MRVFSCGVLFLLIFFRLGAEQLNISVRAESAILMRADNLAVLYEKNADKLQYPASITKIATAIYTLELRENKLDKVIVAEHDSIASVTDKEVELSNYTLPSHWLTRGASHIGIKRGEELTLESLLYGLMLSSGNDAANVIALYMGGTMTNFMKDLNAFLKGIGCTNTTFKNPHGLHHPEHQTTAFDMAILAAHALKNPTFTDIVKTVSYTRPKTNKQNPTTLIQTNRLIKRGKFYYPRAIGIKTGYTSKANCTIVAAAKNHDRTLIAVLLNCKDRDKICEDAKRMLEEAFKEEKIQKTMFRKGVQIQALIVRGAAKNIKTYLKDNIVYEYYPAEERRVICHLHWNRVNLPVEKGDLVGVITLTDDKGLTFAKQPLFAMERVDFGLFYKFFSFVSAHKLLAIVFSFGVFLLILFRRR